MVAVTSSGFFCHAAYPPSVIERQLSTSALELLAIVVACRLWGHLWSRQKLLVQCDNEGVTHAVNKGRSRVPFMQAALRRLWLEEARHGFTIRCKHIPGISNTLPDLLSRCHLSDSYWPKINCLVNDEKVKKSKIRVDLFDMDENV